MRRWLLAWAALAAASCAPEPRPCGLEVCDIRTAACHQRVAEWTACLRQIAPVIVPTRVISYREYLAAALGREVPPAEVEQFDRTVAGLALLGLSPAGLTLKAATEQTAWAAAYYSMNDRSITVVDRGEPMASRAQVTLLVHEYMHALQDATVGINAYFAPVRGSDASLAAQAVIEGEASLVEDLAEVGLFDYHSAQIPWPRVFARWHASARARMYDTPAPVLLADLYFIYPFGAALLQGAWSAGGWPAVDALYQRAGMPASSRQVLAGFGASEPAGGPWSEQLGDESLPALPPAYRLILSDTMGSWVLESFLARLGPDTRAVELARRLRGDNLSIQYDGASGITVSCWRLRFADEAAAQEALVLAQTRFRGSWRRGRDLVVPATNVVGVAPVIGPDHPFRSLVTTPPPPTPAQRGGGGRIACPARALRQLTLRPDSR